MDDSIKKDSGEKQKNEVAFHKNEGMYCNFYENISEGVMYQDSDGQIIYVNPAACRILGLTSEELIGKDFHDPAWKILKEDLSELKNEEHPSMVALHTGEKVTGTIMGVIRPVDNTLCWVQVDAIPDFEPGDNKPVQVLTTFRDITTAHNLFREIKINRDRLLDYLNKIDIGLWIRDEADKLVFVNDGLSKIFGISTKQFYEKNQHHYLDYVHPNDRDKVLAMEQRHNDTGRQIEEKFRIIRPDGEVRWVHTCLQYLQIMSLSDRNSFMGTMQDVTEQEAKMELIRSAKTRADELNRLRSNIISMVSYEFRTPITGLLGFTSLLKEKVKDERKRDLFDMIEHSTQRLQNTLESILSYAILDSKHVEVRPSVINIELFTKKKLEEISYAAEQKGLYFQVFFSDQLELKTDRDLLLYIIYELLHNAVKFTSTGGVKLFINVMEKRLTINLQDTGPGIPEKYREMVFDPFIKIYEADIVSFSGTGMGLAVVKKKVEILGGTIECKENEYGGTSFFVDIPHHGIPDDSSCKAKLVSSEKEIRILYVEDNDLLQHMVKGYLHSYDFYQALNAEKALDIAKKQKIDIFLLDINLGPGMNGIELCRELRNIPLQKNSIYFAVTAFSQDQVDDHISSDLFDTYIGKPFEMRTLLDLIQKKIRVRS